MKENLAYDLAWVLQALLVTKARAFAYLFQVYSSVNDLDTD